MSESRIDRATFEALQQTAGDDFVKELVDTFLEEAPVMLRELRAAFDAHEPERFRRTAHSLKSNSNTFGALRLGSMARDLELGGLEKALDAGPGPLSALDHEYQLVAAELKELAHA